MAAASVQPAQAQVADNLEKQLGEIMVQVGRMLQAPRQNPERAEQIIQNAKKKVSEATVNFHYTLDMVEIEITRAKAVFIRDLHALRDKQKVAAVPVQAQPPAPMVIELDSPQAEQASVPVAPMMASASPSPSPSPYMQNRPAPNPAESKPVAPFPDMGMGGPSTPVPFHPAKAAERKGPKGPPSPKQTPKSGPPSTRPAKRTTSPLVTRKQTFKASASAIIPPPPPPSTTAPPASSTTPVPQNAFTTATFTLDPINNEKPQTQSSSQDSAMHLISFDNTTTTNIDDLGLGRTAAGGNQEPKTNTIIIDDNKGTGYDSTRDDLDHFFNLGEVSNTNFANENFNTVSEFNNFNFETFE